MAGGLAPVARRLRALPGCRRGVSALEFALAAPILCIGALMLVDVGLGIGARMELDRNLRAGVQAAMTLERSEAEIAEIIQLAAGTPLSELTVTPECQCGAQASACDSFCGPNEPPSVFVAIRASRDHPGPMSGGKSISVAARVQVR